MRKVLKIIKNNVSQIFDIETEQLNEISLEDIEIEPSSRQRIYKTLYDMAMVDQFDHPSNRSDPSVLGLPCTGFWVENTKELILFAWCRHRSKTIVIPPDEWFLRNDIIVN